MVTILAAASTALLAPMLGVALYNLIAAPRLDRVRPSTTTSSRRASVLIPARDEATNLRELLPLLREQRGVELEIIVFDDQSTDDTVAVVGEHAAADPRIRLVNGPPLPPGWLGKNHACHHLAMEASGEILIFTDADVRPGLDTVSRTVALMETEGAGAVTAILRQEVHGWAEAAVVPLVTQIVPLAALPLRLVSRLPSPAFSMGNGQWLAFTRAAYDRSGGHAGVRDRVAEDVALARAVKRGGDRLVVAVGGRTIRVRMYRGVGEVRSGFGKNLYALLGASPLALLAGAVLWSLAAVVPWVLPLSLLRPGDVEVAAPVLPFLLLAGIRASGALLYGHGWREVALHPLGALVTLAIAVESAVRARWGRTTWKGRPISIPDSS